jgi:hypothetical protein
MNDLSFEEAKGQLPWTEGGKELLIHFEALINQLGGREIAANKIDGESMNHLYPYKWAKREQVKIIVRESIRGRFTPIEDQFIKDNWLNMSISIMSQVLKRNRSSIWNRGRDMDLELTKTSVNTLTKGGNKQAA